ncbi:hypothetical protein [Legionella israelensis]|uniref:hypothetical protein n=1 Tax=Legionella israelensis TaxID=454 RepID=UPI00267D3906
MNRINRFSWKEIKHKIKQVNESIYKVIEEIKPDDKISFFIANYNFGEHFGIKNHAYLPTSSGVILPFLTDTKSRNLGY